MAPPSDPYPAAALTTAVVQRAASVFDVNFVFGFVGGSFAHGRARPTSDVDVFVCLAEPDHPTERGYATWLRDLHADLGRDFEHCGEIVDRRTLDQLITTGERTMIATPQMPETACYQCDCMLSSFRKADVVLKFLVDPKVAVAGDTAELSRLQDRAAGYFAAWDHPRVQRHKGELRLTDPARRARLERWTGRLSTGDWAETPVGIGLDRWFRALPPPSARVVRPSVPTPSLPVTRCPLEAVGSSGPVLDTIRWQCLADENWEESTS